MTIINPVNVNEIEFDQKDLAVFEIKDIKERIAIIRKHFFPRLELLRKSSLGLVETIYDIDSSIGMGNISSPNNRKDATTNTGGDRASLGISGKRRDKNDPPLAVRNAQGKSKYIHSSLLTFEVTPDGDITVVFSLCSISSVESSFINKVKEEMQSNFELLNAVLMSIDVYYNLPTGEYSDDFYDLINLDSFNLLNNKNIKKLYFFSRSFDFPTNFENELWRLELAFVGLYPLLDLFISIGDGKETRFTEMLNKFNECYLQNKTKEVVNDDDPENVESELIAPNPKNGDESEIDTKEIESKLDFNPKSLVDARKRIYTQIVQRQGQPKFRSELLKAYNGKCAITDCDVEAVLEAAHIISYLGIETNCLANGLLLRADIHTLFDLYLISIDPITNQVAVSSQLLNTCYTELHKKVLKLPHKRDAKPSSEALANHYEKFLHNDN